GEIILKKDNFVILQANGVGYEVFLSAKSMDNIPQVGQALKLFCYLDVGERSLKLFGFLSFDELELFKIIRNIQGVGPRASLEISAAGSLEKVQQELKKGDNKFLDNIHGIGAKKAGKIILELSGLIRRELSSPPKRELSSMANDEAFLALVNLGFSKDKVKQALTGLAPEISDTQERIRQALKLLG
ncbi:MAG: Holliday junction branch migration protein RuvA, partial [Patescibacteria group bacterium]